MCGELIMRSNLKRISILLFEMDVWSDILSCIMHNTRSDLQGTTSEAADDHQRHGQGWDIMASRDGTRLCGGIGEDSMAIVVPTPIVCEDFLQVNPKILSSVLDRKDSC